ncbi:MAG: isocitrate/isopropylmalate dehydrogenase family protein [Lachnospiraceae bacterium]|nr:isocitrate/isopropylmalate dehydrogenase family protein [Lachnospiraceae bacterium]
MKIAIIPGDGIGKEVTMSSLEILKQVAKKFDLDIKYDIFPFGGEYYLETGISIPSEIFSEWPNKYNAILLGAVGNPNIVDNTYAKDILLGIRKKFDLYVNYRPVYLLNDKYCPLKNINTGEVDFAVIRENTEEFYINCGGRFKANTMDEVVIENSIHTRKGVERIIRYAFEYAKKFEKKSVLMSDKGNAMVHAGELWKSVFESVGKEYPDIKKIHMYIDALHMELLRDPKQFDVVVTSNCFGDIFTDACSQVMGGMGLGASANINPENNLLKGMYEPIHGSAPDIVGKNIANPMASFLCLGMLLEDQGLQKCSVVIREGIKKALEHGVVTPDLGGSKTTSEVTEYLIKYVINY